MNEEVKKLFQPEPIVSFRSPRNLSTGCLVNPESPNYPKFDLVTLKTLNSTKFGQNSLKTLNIIPHEILIQ